MRILITILLLGFGSIAFCQEMKVNKKKDFQDWQFRGGPYFWLLGVTGTIETPTRHGIQPINERENIDKSYSDIKNSLKFGLSMNLEYYRKRWTGIINFASFTIDGEDITPDELIIINVLYRWSPTFGEAKIGYQFLSKEKVKIDGLIGAQLNYSEITMTVNAGTSDIKTHADKTFKAVPIMAVRLKYIPHYRVELSGYVDYAPFSSQDELNSQFRIESKILPTKWLYVSAGYKYWFYKQVNSQSFFNGALSGFFIRAGIQF